MWVRSLARKSRTRLADGVFDTFVTRTLRPLSTASLMQTAGHKNGSTHSQPQTSLKHRIAVFFYSIPIDTDKAADASSVRFPFYLFPGLFY